MRACQALPDPQERSQCRLALAMAKGLDCPVVAHRLDHLSRDPAKEALHH